MIRFLTVALVVAVMAGCAIGSPRVDRKTATSNPSPDYTHRLNSRQSVSVGEPMTSSSPLLQVKTLTFDQEIMSTTSHRGRELNAVAPVGLYTSVAIDSNGEFFESVSRDVTVNGKNVKGGLYMPNLSSGMAAIYWHWHLSSWEHNPLTVYIADLPEIPVATEESTGLTIPEGYYDGLVSTLSYIGKSGEQISFVYREYGDGLARAAFTQEVTLDYEPGGSYAYKSAEFIVHEADARGISYTLLSSL